MIEQIIEHIKKDDIGKEYFEYNDSDLIAIIKYYYYHKLQWCGCGMPGEAMRTVAKYLEARNLDYPQNKEKLNEYFPGGDDNPLVLCLAYELDRAEFTEHGTSIYSCWLLDDGKYFLWAIKEADKQGVLDI